jgi:hypothetical protein
MMHVCIPVTSFASAIFLLILANSTYEGVSGFCWHIVYVKVLETWSAVLEVERGGGMYTQKQYTGLL